MNLVVVGLFVLQVALAPALAAQYHRVVSYEGESVVRCLINRSGKSVDVLLSEGLADPWGVSNGGGLDFRVSTQRWQMLQDRLPECQVVIDDVETFVRGAEREMFNVSDAATWFEEYHNYDDIVDWYKDLANKYSDRATYVDSIGNSVEGRSMPAVHLTKNSSPKEKIYFQCQIHAREWISGAVCMYIANYICENYERNPTVKRLLDELEFVFVPFVNPDGYEYTWNGDRLWRKNRSDNKGSSCRGVDLNRNYNDHWGGGGSSSNACSETYRGPSVASEPETQNTQNYFKSNAPIIGAIDWHSYSQLILRPYGWTQTDCPDEAQLKAVGDEMSNSAYNIHGVRYTSQKSIGLYITTGTASDWFYGEDATKDNDGYRAAGFTIELRDTGRYGFLLPPDQIIPNGEEMVPAALYFAKSLLDNPLKPN